jgi:hypothetical protein
MIFIIVGVLVLIQLGLTFALALGLKRLVPEFPVVVRCGIAFAVVFMSLGLFFGHLLRGGFGP